MQKAGRIHAKMHQVSAFWHPYFCALTDGLLGSHLQTKNPPTLPTQAPSKMVQSPSVKSHI